MPPTADPVGAVHHVVDDNRRLARRPDDQGRAECGDAGAQPWPAPARHVPSAARMNRYQRRTDHNGQQLIRAHPAEYRRPTIMGTIDNDGNGGQTYYRAVNSSRSACTESTLRFCRD